jgi:hypothetical protein
MVNHADDPRLYLLVRRDLPRSVQAVQAAHAAVQYAERRSCEWQGRGIGTPTIAMLSVADRAELEQWAEKLGRRAERFHEPDLDDQMTAVAYFGADNGFCFGKLRLAG